MNAYIDDCFDGVYEETWLVARGDRGELGKLVSAHSIEKII